MKTRCLASSPSLLTAMAVTVAIAGYAQPTITNQPQTQATAVGTTATFTVGARGTQPLAYQWQKNPGSGYSDVARGTNALLELNNVQPWEAADYRAVVADLNGARTTSVAHLYVMSKGWLTNRLVIDNFDDNKNVGWLAFVGGPLVETNQEFTLHGYWPGVITHDPPDSVTVAETNRTWSVANGQTIEWRVDLVRMNEGATAAVIEPVNSTQDGLYVLFKGRDFIHLNKYMVAAGGPANFLHENTSLPNSNVVVALALTRISPDLILTARVLDKANPNIVLYERSVVDTPRVDHTLTEAEVLAQSGMRLHAVSDLAGPPWSSGYCMFLDLFQYNNDGKQPPAEVTLDNFELWTYRVPIVRYVDAASLNPSPPYTTWATAAHVIQDAVDTAITGDEIVVTNGVYATGGRAVGTNLLVNRVAVDKPITLRSVNGPQFTVIQGYQVPGTTNGDDAVRCVYLADGASLFGFTLTNGATRNQGYPDIEQWGAGLWCESSTSVASNCVLIANSTATGLGGGAFSGTLIACKLIGNSALNGGGAYSRLYNCVLTANSASDTGGGACFSLLNNCLVIGNSARVGGGVFCSRLYNCTLTGNSADYGGGAGGRGYTRPVLNNCIVYSNIALVSGPNYEGPDLNYCCTVPLPENGVGNITNPPLFVDYPNGNLRLQPNSPCINAGKNAYVTNTLDLDGNPRIAGGTVDIGAYEFQSPQSTISYAWLQQYGLPTDGSADALDLDADGHNNWQEWICGTCPTNALSALRMLSAAPSGHNLTVTWASVAGPKYFLDRTKALTSTFTRLAVGIPGQSGTTTYTDTNAVGPGPFYYRVGVTPE